jgi:outer membrane protein TolC
MLQKLNLMKLKCSTRHNHLKNILIFFIILAGPCQVYAAGPASDTLQLEDAINQMVKQYPTINLAMEALNASDAKIGMARSGYLPDVNISAAYARIGPVPSFDFPQFGHIKLYPENNYTAGVNVNQTIWDFGRTSGRVSIEQEGRSMAEQNIELVKDLLTKRLIYVYYFLFYSQEALKINDEQIQNLREHLDLIIKEKETGSATDYEVLSTQVKLTAAESQKTDLESNITVQMAILNSFLGQPEGTKVIVSERTFVPMHQEIQDSTISQALRNRMEIKMAEEHIKIMQMHIDLAKSDRNPFITAYASAGGKNGYVPDINKFQANFSAGIGLRIPIYDASRTRNTISLAQSSFLSSKHEKDITALEITNEVVNYYQKELAATKKVEQTQLQVDQAKKAFDLASTSYAAGVITNLDLLDATTSLSESHLRLLKARIDLLIGYYELQIAEGAGIGKR